MSKYLTIDNGVVSNIILADAEFAASIGAIEAPDGVQIGDLYDGETFTTPTPAAMPEAQRIAALWQAAHDKEYAAISGSAIGLITMGVLQAKPKCLAVQAWIKAIWTEYYTRKASTSTDTNFDAAGECPHTVPELMAELGL